MQGAAAPPAAAAAAPSPLVRVGSYASKAQRTRDVRKGERAAAAAAAGVAPKPKETAAHEAFRW